jgi:hypothetical protein
VRSLPWWPKWTSTRTEPISSARHDRRRARVCVNVSRRRPPARVGDRRGNGNVQVHVSA